MARAVWKGTLTFGLAILPVGRMTAVRDARPRLRMLHARDEWTAARTTRPTLATTNTVNGCRVDGQVDDRVDAPVSGR